MKWGHFSPANMVHSTRKFRSERGHMAVRQRLWLIVDGPGSKWSRFAGVKPKPPTRLRAMGVQSAAGEILNESAPQARLSLRRSIVPRIARLLPRTTRDAGSG